MIDIYLAIFYLAVSLLLYVLFGGADFGMGVIERLLDQKKAPEKLTKSAIGPIWEANHVWLIVVIVILFTCFPKAFSALSIVAHVPLFLLLIGIVMRGTAFTFRHYDPIQDRSHHIHDLFFSASSIFSAFLWGVTVGGLSQPFSLSDSYWVQYVKPFLTPFALSAGLLSVGLTILIASTLTRYEKAAKPYLFRLSVIHNITSWVVLGLGILTLSLHPIGVSTLWIVVPLGFMIVNKNTYGSDNRLWHYGGITGLVFSLFVGHFNSLWPTMVMPASQQALTFFNTAAPQAALRVINICLTLGLIIIIPFLGYLIFVFKGSQTDSNPIN